MTDPLEDHEGTARFKIRPMRSLVTSIFMYACESWTLTAELQKEKEDKPWKRGATARCYALHAKTVTNEEVHAKIMQAIGPHEDLLTTVKRRKLQRYGHVSRSSGLAKTILQGTVKGGRRQGRERKRWEDSIRGWTGLEFAKFPEGSGEQGKIEETGCEIICGALKTLAVKG